MAAKKRVDYDRIEAGWRAGLLSPHQLAAQYTAETDEPVSHAAIIKHFTKLGVPRDLSAKIEAKAKAKVEASMVTRKVTDVTKIPEREIVEAVASTQATVRLAHRADIERTRRICMSMMTELEQQGTDGALMAEAADILRSTPTEEMSKEKRAKLADVAAKAGSLQSRSSTMRALSESLKSLIALERQAFGIREEMPEPPPPGIEAVSTKELLAVVHALKGGAQ